MDRLDLQLRLVRLPAAQLRQSIQGLVPIDRNDQELKGIEQIMCASKRMLARNPVGMHNRDLSAQDLGRIGQLDEEAIELWEQVVDCRQLSAQSGLRLLRVTRSLADLHDQDRVSKVAWWRQFVFAASIAANTELVLSKMAKSQGVPQSLEMTLLRFIPIGLSFNRRRLMLVFAGISQGVFKGLTKPVAYLSAFSLPLPSSGRRVISLPKTTN